MEPLSIAFALSVVIQLTLAVVIFAGSKEYSSRTFVSLTLLSVLWMTSEGIFHAIPKEQLFWATVQNGISFGIGIILATMWVYFCLVFPENKKPHWGISFSLFLINILLLPVYLFQDLFLGPAVWIGGIGSWAWEQGPFLFVYDVMFISLWFTGFFIIWKKSRKYTGTIQKNLRLMFFTLSIAFLPIEITALLLPRILGYFNYEWVSSLTMLGWPLLMSYSIVKHNQMNVRTVYTELLIIIAIFILFISIFV